MLEETYQHLTDALTAYDCRTATRAGYNRFGLLDQLERLADIRLDVAAGRPLRHAIIAGFQGHLLTVLLASIGEPPATAKDKAKVYAYKPAVVA